jgi:hypothetical protein
MLMNGSRGAEAVCCTGQVASELSWPAMRTMAGGEVRTLVIVHGDDSSWGVDDLFVKWRLLAGAGGNGELQGRWQPRARVESSSNGSSTSTSNSGSGSKVGSSWGWGRCGGGTTGQGDYEERPRAGAGAGALDRRKRGDNEVAACLAWAVRAADGRSFDVQLCPTSCQPAAIPAGFAASAKCPKNSDPTQKNL